MSTSSPRRERVAPNLYKCRDANGRLRWELGYRDGAKQRWERLPPETTKTAARALLGDFSLASTLWCLAALASLGAMGAWGWRISTG